MNSYEFELWIEQYKVIIKDKGERPLFDSEIKKLDENIDFIPDEYKNAFTAALGGDFGEFETLPHLLRNYLGALELKKFREKFDGDPSLDRTDVREYLENNSMNAALRAGISAEKNANKTREFAKALDSYMNHIFMKRTMAPITEEAKSKLSAQLNDEAQVTAVIDRNNASQLVIAKTMLLAQLGKYDVIDENGLSSVLDVPVYETLVHGNRTNFVLPGGANSGGVINAFMGQSGGADAGIQKRAAATHSVKLRSFSKSGILQSESKELRTYSPFKVFANQYGMNIAAGGVGMEGPNQKIITGSGESGHIYMRAEQGDAKHCGSLLIGVEGSAPGKSDYLGNPHDIRAKSAKQSPFLADKTIMGTKIGGRQVDLSGISAEDLTNILNTFSQKYLALQNKANTREGREKLFTLNDMLMGGRMDVSRLVEMFDSLGMKDSNLENIITNARGGYLSRANAGEITEREFKQSVRSQLSSEQACNIAESRFAHAGGDLSRSVGAIKELTLTHATRTLGWKLRHPIKNYREYATINDLTKRLETEKKFSRDKIREEFARETDFFTADWGESLSYDRGAIKFVRENKQNFKIADKAVLDGREKNSGDKVKENANDQIDNREKTHEEPEKIFEKRVQQRENISIIEESESYKVAGETSELITQNQPINKSKKEL